MDDKLKVLSEEELQELAFEVISNAIFLSNYVITNNLKDKQWYLNWLDNLNEISVSY